MSDEKALTDLYSMRPLAVWRALIREHLAFWFACGYLICEYVRPQSIYPWLDFLPWAQLMILGGLALSCADPKRGSTPNVESRLLGVYFALILFSCVTAFHPDAATSKLRDFIAWILVYALLIRVVSTRERLIMFLLLYMLVNLKMTQHGFLVWAARGFSFDNWGVTGAPGWFQNSGEFGIQLTIFIPMVLAFIEALRVYWSKPVLAFFLIMPVTGFGSVVATSSRGAQLAIAVTAGWFVLLTKYRMKAILGAVVAGLLLWSVMPPEQVARLSSSGEDATSRQRIIYWKRGIEMMVENPLTGIGYGNWVPVYTERYPYDRMHELPHNIFIQAAAELGFPGLTVFTLMIIYVFVNNSRTRKFAVDMNDRIFAVLAVGMDAALIGFVISGSFVSVLYYPYFWVHMAMCVALHGVAYREWEAHVTKVAGLEPGKSSRYIRQQLRRLNGSKGRQGQRVKTT